MDFDPSIIRSGSTANLDTLIDVLKALCVKHTFHPTGAGYDDYSSGTTTTLASLSVDCEEDELILFYTSMQVSVGTVSATPGASSIAHSRHKVDATAQGDDFFEPAPNYAVSSTGTGRVLRNWSFWSGLSGTKSFELQWQNDGPGTIYTVGQRLDAFNFKIRT